MDPGTCGTFPGGNNQLQGNNRACTGWCGDTHRAAAAFTPKKGATIIKKVLESAIANAEHNDGADIDALSVKRIHVERGQFLKRFQARAKGRGARILKHTCHIYITVGD